MEMYGQKLCLLEKSFQRLIGIGHTVGLDMKAMELLPVSVKCNHFYSIDTEREREREREMRAFFIQLKSRRI
jgi:hypothetical protein